ncbi:MAG: TIGR00341 family protein [Gammaproteobacteria bacterium]|jgi:uncharacterized hydrophobic protein (TIGR00341 family)
MKIIEIATEPGNTDTVKSIAEQFEAVDQWIGPEGADGRQLIRLLIKDESTQQILDALQSALGSAESARIVLLEVEAVLPRPEIDEDEAEKRSITASREALYEEIEKNAHLNRNFVTLVFLSTIVAAIGLLENNLAVVIGAMVIAPLLGPNLALALGTALGDTHLMRHAVLTNLAGLALAVGMSVLIGLLSPIDTTSHELVSRTSVGMDSVALALASGAAAVLSITTGLPAVLVGVMVAVALLPPAATFGIMLGSQHYGMAIGAGILLAVNVVCVNLAAKLVFLIQGIKPRTWIEKKKARQSMTIYIAIWIISLLILIGLIYIRQ